MVIRTIRNIEELAAVQTCWEDLQYHPNSDFAHFQLVCGLRQEVIYPHVTILEQNGQPCALLAARLEHGHFVPSIGYLKPVRISAKILTVLYQGLLGQVDGEQGQALVWHLNSLLAAGEADAVVFHYLPEQSKLMHALMSCGPRLLCEKKPTWSAHWEMSLPNESGFLLNKLKAKHRSRIRSRQRKLETDFPGKVFWHWMNHFDDLSELCAKIEEVASRTYHRGLGVGFIDDKDHRQRFALFAGRGQLRMQLLKIDGRIRAFWIGTVYKGVFHSSETAYDPELSIYEPGTLIFLQMVDALVREGVRKIDFGLGDAFYKRRFGDSCWRESTVRLFAPSAKGLALHFVLGFFKTLEFAGRHLVQKTGLLDRLKASWRRYFTKS